MASWGSACPAAGEAQVVHSEGGLGVASPERAEQADLVVCIVGKRIRIGDNEIDLICWSCDLLFDDFAVEGEFRCFCCLCYCTQGFERGFRAFIPVQEVLAQFFDIGIGDGEAGCLGMSSMTLEKICTFAQGLDDVEPPVAACGATARHRVSAQYKDRAFDFFGELASHQANDTLRPGIFIAVNQHYLLVRLALRLLSYKLHQLLCLLLARLV